VVIIFVVIFVSVNCSSFCTFSPPWIVLATRLCDLSRLGKYLVTALCPIYQGEKLHSPGTNLGTICANPKSETLELLENKAKWLLKWSPFPQLSWYWSGWNHQKRKIMRMMNEIKETWKSTWINTKRMQINS
jgi:hypothetical protein